MKKTTKPEAGLTVALTIGGLPLVCEPSGETIREAEDVRRLLDDVAQLAQEAMIVLTLNQKYKLIRRHLVTLGIANASLAHPREIFRVAIADGACAVILAHNHPSGLAEPSTADHALTEALKAALAVVDVKVLDHIIVAGTDTLSFADRGLL